MSDNRPTDIGPPPTPNANPIVDRVKAILLTPKTEWPRIEAESATPGEIFRTYAVPLAAIGPVARLIGSVAFGYSFFGVTWRPSLGGAIGSAIVSYALSLLGVWVLALVIDALAPNFGATKNRANAFKVAAYGATAGWIAGIFGLIPSLAFLSILGLYSLYLVYLGLPVLMKAPAERAGAYVGVVLVACLVIGLVVGALAVPVMRMFSRAPVYDGTLSGALQVPRGGSVDMGKLEAAGKQLEAASQGNGAPALAPDVLAGMLPASLPGGLARTSIESASGGAGAFGGSTAEAAYGGSNGQIRLKLSDLGAAGALAAFGQAFNLQSSKQTATGYERVGNVDGRMTAEKFDTSDKSGSYSTLIGNRVMVEAKGNALSIDALRGAVATIDLAKLDTLVKG